MPTHIGVTPAGIHDQKAFEQIAGFLPASELYADKTYSENAYSQEADVNLIMPVKKQKGQALFRGTKTMAINGRFMRKAAY